MEIVWKIRWKGYFLRPIKAQNKNNRNNRKQPARLKITLKDSLGRFRPFFLRPFSYAPLMSTRTQFWWTILAVFWALFAANPLPLTPFRNLWREGVVMGGVSRSGLILPFGCPIWTSFFWTISVDFLTRVTWKKAKVRLNFSEKFM